VDIIKANFDQIILDIKKGTYQCIGSGSGRRVFDLNNGYVVKVAKNNRGVAQNEAEYRIASENNTNIFAKIAQVSENYNMLIMEKSEPVKNISEVWKSFHVRSNRELFQQEELKDMCSKHNLLLIDLCRPVNWGKIKERSVIIDYGFTRSVKRKYYMPF
jgi:hypothetical protein